MKNKFCILNIDKEKKIAKIAFNRPKKLNAFTTKGVEEWQELMKEVESDENVRVIILKGSGKCFGTGFDINELGPSIGIGKISGRRPSQRQRLLALSNLHYGVKGYCNLPHFILKPIIAQVHGFCYGSHFQIATACDITIASTDALFADPANKIIGPTLNSMVTLFLTIGLKRTKEIMLSGKIIDAKKALEYGLVNKVVNKSELEKIVIETAENLSKQPFDGLVMGKANLQLAMNFSGIGNCITAGPISHALQNNIRYEPGEFNLLLSKQK